MKKLNVKAIDEKLKPKGGNRGPVTVYLDKDLFKRFQKACGDVSASKVIEEMIGQYVEAKRK